MLDINQFPSGLSNWEGTDKPKREHFVNDNRILDEDAMWKADYDQTGEISEVGIAEFVHDYVGAQLLGLPPVPTDTADGFVTYLHTKVGNMHQLTPVDDEGDNIKFIAIADFNAGDSISIGGTVCATATPDGAALTDGAFITGSTVICYRNGNTLTFSVNSVLLSGATFTGNVVTYDTNRSARGVRNTEVHNSSGSIQSTSWIKFVRE
jgi:hypothetical protein